MGLTTQTYRVAPTVLVMLLASPCLAADRGVQTREAKPPQARRVIVDSRSLALHSAERRPKTLSDIAPEEAEIIRAINRTRGTWETYLGYTSKDLRVPLSRPGFIITLPPPSKKAREAAREAAARKPTAPEAAVRQRAMPRPD